MDFFESISLESTSFFADEEEKNRREKLKREKIERQAKEKERRIQLEQREQYLKEQERKRKEEDRLREIRKEEEERNKRIREDDLLIKEFTEKCCYTNDSKTFYVKNYFDKEYLIGIRTRLELLKLAKYVYLPHRDRIDSILKYQESPEGIEEARLQEISYDWIRAYGKDESYLIGNLPLDEQGSPSCPMSTAMKNLSKRIGRDATPHDLYLARGYLEMEDIRGFKPIDSSSLVYFNTPRKILLPHKYYCDGGAKSSPNDYSKLAFYTLAEYQYYNLFSERISETDPITIKYATDRALYCTKEQMKEARKMSARNFKGTYLRRPQWEECPLKVNPYTFLGGDYFDENGCGLDYNKLYVEGFTEVCLEKDYSLTNVFLNKNIPIVISIYNKENNISRLKLVPYAIDVAREILVFKIHLSAFNIKELRCIYGLHDTNKIEYFWIPIRDVDLKTNEVTVQIQGKKHISIMFDLKNERIPYLSDLSNSFKKISGYAFQSVGSLAGGARLHRQWGGNQDVLFVRGDSEYLYYNRFN